MATPLAELLDAILFDPGVREHFQQSSEHFLRSAGHENLDAADIQEALFVLADGSPPLRAAQLIAGGKAIGDPVDLDGLDDLDGHGVDAADGLVAAIEAMMLDEPGVDDPQNLDDVGTDIESGGDLATDPDTGVASTDDESDFDGTEFGAGTGDEPMTPETVSPGVDVVDAEPEIVGHHTGHEPTIDDGIDLTDPTATADPMGGVLGEPDDSVRPARHTDQHTDPLDDPDNDPGDAEWSNLEG